MKLKKYKTSLQYQKFWFWFEIQRKVFLIFFLQEEKNSRKLIQPDLLAMSQLLNFDEVRQPDCGRDKQIIFVTQEDEASDSEEEVPEVAAIEDKREERGSSEEGGTTLNLTLEEVRHIRTALTRAELEVKSVSEKKDESWDIPDFLPGPPTFRVSGPTLLLLYEQ